MQTKVFTTKGTKITKFEESIFGNARVRVIFVVRIDFDVARSKSTATSRG